MLTIAKVVLEKMLTSAQKISSRFKYFQRNVEHVTCQRFVEFSYRRDVENSTYGITLGNKARPAGFTLIEIMIVMAIMAAVITVALPQFKNRNQQVRGTIRKFKALGKQLKAYAKLNNKTYRLAFQLQDPNSVDPQSFWVEVSEKQSLQQRVDAVQGQAEAANNKEQDTNEELKEGVYSPPDGWKIEPKIFKKPSELPAFLKVADIELGGAEKPVTEGVVYIHFFPQGLTEEAAIHLVIDENTQWTVATHPLTGRVDVIGRYVELKKLRQQ